MCPSMADTDFYAKKPPKIINTTTTSSSDQVMIADNHAASKYFHQFLIKALIVTIFLVILPLLPSQAPEFINQNLHAGSWELLQLIFVGIAVSYGLFSKRNDDDDIFRQSDKELNNHQYSKLDTAHSYVSRLLQVSSVFDDDEAEIHSSSASDDNKLQAWNSRYYREEPAVVVVPKEKSVLERQNSAGVASRIDEKPLLLPVRSLKSRVIETNNESETVRQESALKPNSVSRSNSNLGSKRYSSSNSRKSRNGESGGGGGASQAKMEENIEENVVHRSPIPWRSRSGRFEIKKEDIAGADAETELLGSYLQTPKMEDSESRRMESRSFRSQSFRSSKPNSAAFPCPCPCPSPNKPSPPTTTPSSPKVLQSPLTYFSSESQAKSVEDVEAVRKKVYYKSSPPPPPPPPPPPFLHNKCQLTKSKSSLSNLRNPQKEMRRSIRSVPNEFSETEIESPEGEIPSLMLLKSVRTIRQSEPPVTKQSAGAASVTTREYFDENNNIIENRKFTDKMMNNNSPNFKRQNFTELFPAAAADEEEEEKREVIEKILLETDNDDDEDSITESEEDDYFEEVLGSSGTEELAAAAAAADVDKKADEFIAKFREQIRLQRIESIRRSAGQLSRNRPR